MTHAREARMREFHTYMAGEDCKIIRPPVVKHKLHDMFAPKAEPERRDTLRDMLGDEYFSRPPEPEYVPKTTRKEKMYKLGELAKMLGRQPGTIRMWIDTGQIPEATHWTAGEGKYRKRLYTHAQVMGLLSICSDMGMIENKRITITHVFRERVRQLWDETAD